jgi:hypothetical protein
VTGVLCACFQFLSSSLPWMSCPNYMIHHTTLISSTYEYLHLIHVRLVTLTCMLMQHLQPLCKKSVFPQGDKYYNKNFIFCWSCILIIFVIKTNLMHHWSLIYFIKQSLGIFIAHHHVLFTLYVQHLARVMRYGDWQLFRSGWNSCTILRINSARICFSLQWPQYTWRHTN